MDVGKPEPDGSTTGLRGRLLDFEQLHVENERRARLDTARAAVAIGEIRRADDSALAADLHRLQGFRPARNDAFERECRRLVALARAVEHLSVRQGAVIDRKSVV